MPEIDYQLVLTIAVLIGALVAFATERFPPAVVAIAVPAILIAAGVLGARDGLSVLSNGAPFAVACMFVLSAALERTGVIDAMGRQVVRLAGHSPMGGLLVFMGVAIVTSAFMNNTPVVVVMIPVAFRLAQAIGVLPSRLLMPLSFAAILGGTCTLIGTSTNLVVAGVAERMGEPAFTIFEITPFGIVVAIVGALYLALIGYRLLPDRPALGHSLAGLPARRFLTEIVVPRGSHLIGRTLAEAGLSEMKNARVVDVLRFNRSMMGQLGTLKLQGGDRLLVRGDVGGLIALHQDAGLAQDIVADVQETVTQTTTILEAVIGPASRLIGNTLADFNARRPNGLFVLAVHRQGENVGGAQSIRFEVGDCLLLEGPADAVNQLLADGDFVALAEPRERPYNTSRAWVALASIIGVLAASTFGLLPIEGAAFLAALACLAAGCLNGEDARRAIDWPVLVIIYSMLALGVAMEKTGAEALIVSQVGQIGLWLGPIALLSAVYLISFLLTEIITNNAVAVLVTPIAIGLAQAAGLDPRPFIIAVMFAASASFSTPIGYQTNTLVYTAGNYRFLDFVKVGLPLNITLWMVATFVIPLFWPLQVNGVSP